MMLLSIFAAFAVGWYLCPHLLRMLSESGLLRHNYQGRQVPVSAGLLFPLSVLPCLLLMPKNGMLAPAALTVTSFAMLGFLDDVAGNAKSRGLGGHLRALLRGELTTGALKAVYGGVAALLAASIAPLHTPVFFGALLIALTANTVNLLDLRPGRALKVFFVGYALLALYTGSGGAQLALMVATAVVLLPKDLRAEAMLGDAGANSLGAMLGLFSAYYLPLWLQLAVLATLVAVHLYAENHSLTKLIGQVPALAWFDALGRQQQPKP